LERILLDSKKDQLVTFTEAASKKLLEVMKEQGSENSYLRVSINETPNGGFEYVFGLVDQPEATDIVGGSTIKTVVDPESVKFVEGSNIDYVEGFQRSGFVISNPNFQSGGGCGGAAGGGCCGGGGAENSGGCGSQAEAQREPAEAAAGGCGGGGGSCGCQG
tara:strand:+ start:130 stop:615 length:486 start_codon:yes stop_codon:yes gene_type:complete